MSAAGSKRFSTWEWVTVLGLAAITVAISKVADLTQNWQDAAVYTVILFVALILALRPAWRHKIFWEGLVVIFVLHVLAVIVLEQSFPSVVRGLHGLPSTIVLMAEGLLIAGILWKKSMRSKSDPS